MTAITDSIISPRISIRSAEITEIDFIHTFLINMFEEGDLNRVIITKEELAESLFKDKIAECIIVFHNDNPAGFASYSFTKRNFTVFNKPNIYIQDFSLPDNFLRLAMSLPRCKWL